MDSFEQHARMFIQFELDLLHYSVEKNELTFREHSSQSFSGQCSLLADCWRKSVVNANMQLASDGRYKKVWEEKAATVAFEMLNELPDFKAFLSKNQYSMNKCFMELVSKDGNPNF